MTVISNPRSSYGQDLDYASETMGTVRTFRAGAAIGVGQIVQVAKATATVGGTTVDVLNVSAATADTQGLIGVAVTEALAAGDVVQVCVQGPCKVRAAEAADVVANAYFTAGTGGRVAAVSAANGDHALGFMLETTAGATDDELHFAWIQPSLVQIS